MKVIWIIGAIANVMTVGAMFTGYVPSPLSQGIAFMGMAVWMMISAFED